jgi:hypothetical protein
VKKFSHRGHRKHRDFILQREKEKKRKSLATEDTENTEILFYKEKKRERDDFTKRCKWYSVSF